MNPRPRQRVAVRGYERPPQMRWDRLADAGRIPRSKVVESVRRNVANIYKLNNFERELERKRIELGRFHRISQNDMLGHEERTKAGEEVKKIMAQLARDFDAAEELEIKIKNLHEIFPANEWNEAMKNQGGRIAPEFIINKEKTEKMLHDYKQKINSESEKWLEVLEKQLREKQTALERIKEIKENKKLRESELRTIMKEINKKESWQKSWVESAHVGTVLEPFRIVFKKEYESQKNDQSIPLDWHTSYPKKMARELIENKKKYGLTDEEESVMRETVKSLENHEPIENQKGFAYLIMAKHLRPETYEKAKNKYYENIEEGKQARAVLDQTLGEKRVLLPKLHDIELQLHREYEPVRTERKSIKADLRLIEETRNRLQGERAALNFIVK